VSNSYIKSRVYFGFNSIGGFVGANITGVFVSIWSFHTALVGGDPVDMTGIKWDLVDSWTAWE
jgi:hypothetical protein